MSAGPPSKAALAGHVRSEARRALVDALPTALADVAPGGSPISPPRPSPRVRRSSARVAFASRAAWARSSLVAGDERERTSSRPSRAPSSTRPSSLAVIHCARGGASIAAEGGAAAAFVVDAFARDAQEGWPTPGARWLEWTVFRALAPRAPRPLRSARARRRDARAAPSGAPPSGSEPSRARLPSALARDPYPPDALVVGALAVVSPGALRQAQGKLGLSAFGRRPYPRAPRASSRDARTTAASLVAGMRDPVCSDELEELTARVFGAFAARGPRRGMVARLAWERARSTRRRASSPSARSASLRPRRSVRRGLVRQPARGRTPRASARGLVVGDVPDAEAARAAARSFEETLG
ncbi:MAG: hypothetical protein KF782_12895 [Labilithrix sp.]|nr:hypothetical protein [Labilithrix sp.]